MKTDLLIFPFGGNAREAADVALAEPGQWNLIGFFDDDPSALGRTYADLPVLGGREVLTRYPAAQVLAVPACYRSPASRIEIIESLGLSPSRYASVRSPSTTVSPCATIGVNTVLMQNVSVMSNAVVGDHTLVRPSTVISHDVVVGKYCQIGSNVTLAGYSSLGACCYVGAGACVREKIVVGAKSVIGMGSVVVKHVKEERVVMGNPAREKAST